MGWAVGAVELKEEGTTVTMEPPTMYSPYIIIILHERWWSHIIPHSLGSDPVSDQGFPQESMRADRFCHCAIMHVDNSSQ